MLYRLTSVIRPDFECEIETDADIAQIINEYYWYERDGNKYSTIYFDIVYRVNDSDKSYRDERIEVSEVCSSDIDQANRVLFDNVKGDIRRALAYILYGIYISNIVSNKKIERLKWKDKEYTHIGNVVEKKDNRGAIRIQFEAENKDGLIEKVLLPIPISERTTLMSKYQSDFYVLENNDRKVEHVFSHIFPYELKDTLLEETSGVYFYTLKDITLDFFQGAENGYKQGVFYMNGEELIPFYALTSKGQLVTGHFGEKQNTVELTEKEKEYFSTLKSSHYREAEDTYRMIESMRRFPAKFSVNLDGTEYVGERYLNGIEIILEGTNRLYLDKSVLQYNTEEEDLIIKWKTLRENHIFSETLYKSIFDEEVGEQFEKNIEELVRVFKEYIEHENRKLVGFANSEAEKEIAKVEKLLYPSPFVPDKAVAKIVYEEKKKYEKTGKMPNFAIMGGPGCGKSTLVDRIAAYMKDVNVSKELVLKQSISDLKGPYIGHTANRVYNLLKEAYTDDKVVFIDEAYHFQSDEFGAEALEMLLPLISGDRTEIKCVSLNKKEELRLKFNAGVPGIWLAGYEQEMREMLVENPGLYRRMIKITLAEPTVEGLYANLLGKAVNDSKLWECFSACGKEIKNYFAWASAKENIAYFGNYAGVEEFYRTCEVRLQGDALINSQRSIREIIDEKKREIKKQYKAILFKNERNQRGEIPKFEIQRDVRVCLDDVKGNDTAVAGMRQIVKMLMEREVYEKGGINVPKGALLVGPPGTGKTMIARALAGEIQRSYDESEKKEKSVAFISVASTELSNTRRVSALFEEAAEYDNSIIFIDELDAIGKHRELSRDPSVLIQLMKEMDGFEERKNIFVMAATNAPEILDPALKRPGRFDRNIEVGYPNEQGRKEILLAYLEKLSDVKANIENDGNEKTLEDLAWEVAEKTVGFVPAELKNLVNEAAILHKEIEDAEDGKLKYMHRESVSSQSVYDRFRADIIEMMERIKVGELVDRIKEQKFQDTENTGSSAVAIHEVGHALVSVLLGIEPFEKITVISRGGALGYVDPSRKNALRTKADYLKRIKVCLGGRVAEEIFYGDDISIGAVQDIQQATTYAENMVMLFGMSERIGPMALKNYQSSYLGNGQSYRCSTEFVSKAEEEVNEILKAQLVETRGMLNSQKDIIKKLAKVVFDSETLTGEEFMKAYEKIKKRGKRG